MSVYDDVIFPTDISFNTPGGPEFLTRVVDLPSGWHQADIKRDTPLAEWDVTYGARKANKIYDLQKLFLVMRGQGHIFLYKDWGDFKSADGDQYSAVITATDQLIATATAGQTEFQLIKNYAVGSATLVKTIYKPKGGVLGTDWKVSVDGAEETTGWTINTSTGIITRSVAPGTGKVIRAGYEYYHPVRFAADKFDRSFISWQAGETQVVVREVRLTA